MKNQPPDELRKELRLAGADTSEIATLLPVAAQMRQLTSSPAPTTHRRNMLFSTGLATATGLVLVALVLFSQSVLPGSRLYPVQKASDNLAVDIHPQYRGTVMMRQARELKTLVGKHASTAVILATLAAYHREAVAYAATSDNYAVFVYCKADLQQAAKQASDTERQAINETLSSLENV